jgi:hypothetical protein
MRIRRDSAFISAVLFTIALLAFFPESLIDASTWRKESIEVVADWLFLGNYYAPLGFACLTIYLVGLIVIWSGYVQRARWAWFVMCVIVWVFAFPTLMLPVLRRLPVNVSAWFREALKENGPSRYHAKATLVFLLMVVALFLPVKSFFRKQSAQQIPER